MSNDKRTYSELCKAAVELERQFQWSAAAELYNLAVKRAKHPPARMAAITKRETALRTAADVASPEDVQNGPLDKELVGPPEGAVEAAMPQAETCPVHVLQFLEVDGSCEMCGAAPTGEVQPVQFRVDQLHEAAAALSAGKAITVPKGSLADLAMAIVDNAPENLVLEAQAGANEIEPTTTKPKKEKTMSTTQTDREALLAKKERIRMKQNKVDVGMELQHIRRGKTLAVCTYAAERCFIFDKKQYTSLSDAGSAAAKKLGMKNVSVNGWLFWGVEKREA